MRTVLLENLRKRIILVIVGVAGYYLTPAPLGMLFRSLSHGELLTSLWMFYAYKGIGISFLIAFHSFWKGNKIDEIEGLLFTYYETEDLMKIMESDFDILGLETYTEMEKNDSIYAILRIKDC